MTFLIHLHDFNLGIVKNNLTSSSVQIKKNTPSTDNLNTIADINAIGTA